IFLCDYPADTPKYTMLYRELNTVGCYLSPACGGGKITSTQYFLIDKGILQWCAKWIVIFFYRTAAANSTLTYAHIFPRLPRSKDILSQRDDRSFFTVRQRYFSSRL
ncbi:hypothetical protein, partial [Ruminococcus albus]|uniref:hypothetical protein n=1 Tax=Ruminococcus albus TaxID=1264 RepID=UPI001A98FB22